MKTNRTFPLVLVLALATGTQAWAESPGDTVPSEVPVAPTEGDEVAQAEEESSDSSEAEADEDEDEAPPVLSPAAPPGTLSALALADEDLDPGAVSPLPFSIGGSIGTGISVGSLYQNDVNTADGVSLNFGLNVGFKVTDDLRGSVSASLSKYVTPHGMVRQYETRFGDIIVGLAAPSFYTIPVADIAISASVSGRVPTSDQSRTERIYTVLSAGPSFTRTFGDFSLSYSLGVTRYFDRYTSLTARNDRGVDVIAREQGAEAIATNRYALPGILTAWMISNNLSAGYKITDDLSASLSWGLVDNFSYRTDSNTADDGLQSEFADLGRGRSQIMSGSIGLSYSFLQRFSVSGSLSTGGPPKTADNERFRFPFWDFQSGNLSYTTVGISLSGRY